jgi:PPP family 3-phenylpropionic acid transporter
VTDSRSPASNSGSSIGDLNLAFILVGAAEAVILPFIPLYLFERGFDVPLIGAVVAGAALGSFVAGPLWANFADNRLGPERTVAVASAVAAAVALLLAVANTRVAVAIVSVALWMARAPLMSLLDVIALGRLGTGGRAGYARIRLRMSAGWAASVLVLGGLFQLGGLRLLPFVYAPVVLVLGFWMWRRLTVAPAVTRVEPAPRSAGTKALNAMPAALISFLISALLLGAAFAATANFVTIRINVLGGGVLLIGAAAAFQAITEIPTMAYTHVLMRYLSARVLYIVGVGIYVLVFIAWAFLSDAVTTALLKLVMGVGFALTYVASVLIADDVAPSHLRATVQALVKSVSGGLAPVLGALGGGVIYGVIGPEAMFLVAGGVAAVAAVIVLIAVPSRRRLHDRARTEALTQPAVAGASNVE